MATPNRTLTLSSIESVPPVASAGSLAPSAWFAGSSAAMTQLRAQMRRVAPFFRTALITGEPGCGEEQAAHILHELSPRSQDPFLELTTIEAELRFQFDDPKRSPPTEGMFYLPRPDRLPRPAQRALLRLLRERGSQAPRIVAFAERGLRPLVTAEGFSADLADSLGALRITLPPLRDRREDIPELLTHMLHHLAAQAGITPPQLAPDLLAAAGNLRWPGNLDQLHSAAEGLIANSEKTLLHAEDLESILGALPQAPPRDRREIRLVPLDDVIHEHIRAVLFACNGNKLRTAEVLGISRSTLYRMLETHIASSSTALPPQRMQMAG